MLRYLFIICFCIRLPLCAQNNFHFLPLPIPMPVYKPYQLFQPIRYWGDTASLTNSKWLAAYYPSAQLPHIDSQLLKLFSYQWIVYYDFYTTLTGTHILNSPENIDVNQLYFYYNLDIKSNLTFLGAKWDCYFFSDYGLRHYWDSITIKTQDQLIWRNSLYYPLLKNKLFLSVTVHTKTKLFNTYQYRKRNGDSEKYLYDGFMSPGIITYSGGVNFEPGHNMLFHVGLGSSKITKIKNQSIFDSRNVNEIQGLKKGDRKKAELGCSITASIPTQQLQKRIFWECNGQLFSPFQYFGQLHYITADVNNVFHVLLFKYVRCSWRTKLGYNFEQQSKPSLQNQLSLGFYLSNHV